MREGEDPHQVWQPAQRRGVAHGAVPAWSSAGPAHAERLDAYRVFYRLCYASRSLRNLSRINATVDDLRKNDKTAPCYA